LPLKSKPDTSAILYWINNNKTSALRHFKNFKVLHPEYSLSNFEKAEDMWILNENIRPVRKKVYMELAEAYENSQK